MVGRKVIAIKKAALVRDDGRAERNAAWKCLLINTAGRLIEESEGGPNGGYAR